MKRYPYLIAAAFIALLAVGYFFIWPHLSPTMPWSRFVGIAEAALKKEDHPVIALNQRVLGPRDGDEDRLLRCGPGQSVTIVGAGRADGDFARMYLGEGDIRLENVRVIGAEEGGIYALLVDAANLSIRLDARCVVQVGSGFTETALYVRLGAFDDGARLSIENAGELRGRNGVMVSVGDHHAYEAEIRNSGLIEAEQSGIVFDDAASGSDSRVHILNTGTITSQQRTTIYANVYAQEGDAAFELVNDGAIRSADYRGVSAHVSTRSGSANMTVQNGERGAIESSEVCVIAGVLGEGRVRIEGEGALTTRTDKPPVHANFNWLIAPSQLPAGWDADEAASRAAAKAYAEDRLAAAGAAALPAGAEISIWVRVSDRQDWMGSDILYGTGFKLRVEEGGAFSPLEEIAAAD